ncbi:hypothetical protein BKA69DRAFT_1083861 [Paraphysoderma sedebokerense]|nr:hypothetical protein BKA69DRAFT_1083861 [Paraphysoderma sedebokerense]
MQSSGLPFVPPELRRKGNIAFSIMSSPENTTVIPDTPLNLLTKSRFLNTKKWKQYHFTLALDGSVTSTKGSATRNVKKKDIRTLFKLTPHSHVRVTSSFPGHKWVMEISNHSPSEQLRFPPAVMLTKYPNNPSKRVVVPMKSVHLEAKSSADLKTWLENVKRVISHLQQSLPLTASLPSPPPSPALPSKAVSVVTMSSNSLSNSRSSCSSAASAHHNVKRLKRASSSSSASNHSSDSAGSTITQFQFTKSKSYSSTNLPSPPPSPEPSNRSRSPNASSSKSSSKGPYIPPKSHRRKSIASRQANTSNYLSLAASQPPPVSSGLITINVDNYVNHLELEKRLLENNIAKLKRRTLVCQQYETDRKQNNILPRFDPSLKSSTHLASSDRSEKLSLSYRKLPRQSSRDME